MKLCHCSFVLVGTETEYIGFDQRVLNQNALDEYMKNVA